MVVVISYPSLLFVRRYGGNVGDLNVLIIIIPFITFLFFKIQDTLGYAE
jgi:hypothetical protein